MKKICFLSLLSLLFVTMPSCSDELDGGKENPGAAGGRTLFTATVEALQSEADTETQNDFWATGDKLKVVLNDNSAISANLIAGQGTESGSFMGTLPEGKTATYAVYPESAFDSADGEGLNLNVPAAQSGYLADCKAAAGVVGVGNKAALKNLTAVLPVNILAGAEVCKVELTSVDGSALAGVVPVTFSDEGLVMGEVQSPSSSVSVEVYGAGTYNFAVLPGTHAQGLKVSWYLSENPSAPAGEKVLDATTFAANTLYEAVEIKTVDKSFYVTVDGAGTKDGKSWANAMSAAAFADMLKAAVYVEPETPEESEPTDPALAEETTDSTEPSVAAFNGATFHFASGTYNFGETLDLTYNEVVTLEFLGGYDANGNRNAENNVTAFTGNKEHQIFNFGSEMQCKFDGINFVEGYASSRGGVLSIGTGSLEFTNCNFSDNEAGENGGAIYFKSGGQLTFDDCDFTNNKVPTDENLGGLGGAIYCGSGTSALVITVDRGTISGNEAYRGGFIVSYNADATFNNVTFTGNEVTGGGGAIYTNSSPEFTLNDCTFTENKALFGGAVNASGTLNVNGCRFEDNYASGNAGAISMGAKGGLKINPLNDEPTLFKDNKAERYSGAVSFETRNGSNKVNGARFIGNSAQWGGAVGVYGPADAQTRVIIEGCVFGGTEEGEANFAFKGDGTNAGRGGAIFHEDESNIVLLRSTIIGNYAENNGGAVAVMGWKDLQMFQCELIGNYAYSGGAIYTEGASEKYANLYIDECSFDGNHITNRYGTTMNINGIGEFCMNNSSVRGSYNSKSRSKAEASWITLDVLQDFASISNCSIIGNTQYSNDGSSFTTITNSSLIDVVGDSYYFTNNIIVPYDAAITSISADQMIDLTYNHYNTVSGVTATDNGGNTTGKTAADFGSLVWTDGCWIWNGQISGAAPEMMTQEAVLARFSNVCPAFVEWCGEDLYKDQLGVVRTGAWWPGAYQKN